jgi:DNA polymerase III alpha subunit
MIYQEDVLKVAHHLAGMSLADADLFRRAMSGKERSHEKMEQLNNQFINGCVKNGVEPKIAKEIWRQIESFAGYSFCKAHSASFAQLSFQVAYLKAHYPAEFMAAVINNGGGFYHTSVYINEAKRMGIKILLPSVNESNYFYTGKDKTIRMGLNQIAEIPYKTKLKIIQKRFSHIYTDLFNFLSCTKISKRNAKILILCGACDCFNLTRPQLMYLLNVHYDEIKKQSPKNAQLIQTKPDFFLPELDNYLEEEKIQAEIDYFGFAASKHPLEFFAKEYEYQVVKAKDLLKYNQKTVKMLGWCISTKLIRTRKKKDLMKFMSMEDLSGTYETILFPNVYNNFAPQTRSWGPYLIEGKVEVQFGTPQIVVEKLTLLNS